MIHPRPAPPPAHRRPLLAERFGLSLLAVISGHLLLAAALLWFVRQSPVFRHPKSAQTSASLIAEALQAKIAPVRWMDASLVPSTPPRSTLASRVPPSLLDPRNDPPSQIALPLPEAKLPPQAPAAGTPPPPQPKLQPPSPPSPSPAKPSPKPAQPAPRPPAPAKPAPSLRPAPAPTPPAISPPKSPALTPIRPAPAPIRPAVVAQIPPQTTTETAPPIRPSVVSAPPSASTAGSGSTSPSSTASTPQTPGSSGIFRQSAPGPGGSSAPSGTAAELASYHSHVKNTYVSQWRQPAVKNGLFQKLRVKTEIVIASDGRVISARIIQQSGNSELDQSVFAALQSVRYLQPLPSTLRQPSYTVVLNFDL